MFLEMYLTTVFQNFISDMKLIFLPHALCRPARPAARVVSLSQGSCLARACVRFKGAMVFNKPVQVETKTEVNCSVSQIVRHS